MLPSVKVNDVMVAGGEALLFHRSLAGAKRVHATMRPILTALWRLPFPPVIEASKVNDSRNVCRVFC